MAKKQLMTVFVGEDHKIEFHGYATKKKVKDLEKKGKKASVQHGVARLVWHEEDDDGIPRPSYEYLWKDGEWVSGIRPPCGW